MPDDQRPYVRTGAGALTRPFVPDRRAYIGQPTLSVQVGNLKHIETVATLCRSTSFGAVITVPPGRTDSHASLKRYIDRYKAAGGDATHLLIDANRYSGNSRVSGKAPLDPGFVRAQLNAGAALGLTDSPYIPDGDTAALHDILDQAKAMRLPTLTGLPLANGWFANPRHAVELRDAISAHGSPVALMIEHGDDPFGVRRIIRGVLTVLGADAPIQQLRCDLSVLGTIAHGVNRPGFHGGSQSTEDEGHGCTEEVPGRAA